ncbi:Ig-like domain-containing protein [Clostridium sp. MB05]
MKKIIMQTTSFLLTILLFMNFNLLAYADNNEGYQKDEDWQISLEASRIPLNSISKNKDDILVTVGDLGLIKRSNDGDNWNIIYTNNKNNLYKVRNINDNFFIVGDKGTLLISSDGLNWEEVYTGVSTNLKDIIFYNDTYYLVGDSGTVLYSSDKYIWNKREVEISENILEMEVFKGEIYMISNNNLYKSTNMKDFMKIKSVHSYISIEANDDKLVIAYKDEGVYEVNPKYRGIYLYFDTTSDGKVWSKKFIDEYDNSKLRWGGGKFLMYSNNGLNSSTDGIDWTRSNNISKSGRPSDLIYYKDKIIIIFNEPYGNSNISKSEDGVNLQDIREFASAEMYTDAEWGNGNFIVVGNNGELLQSFDGVKWNKDKYGFREIVSTDYGPLGYVACGAYCKIYFSKNGDLWTIAETPELSSNRTVLNDIKWVGDRYICVSTNGEVLSSFNGLNWEKIYQIDPIPWGKLNIQNIVRANGSTWIYNYNNYTEETIIIKTDDYSKWDRYEYKGRINEVIFADGKYYAIGKGLTIGNDSILSSIDGISWNVVKKFGISLYNSNEILWTGEEFRVASDQYTIISKDGVDWEVLEAIDKPIGGAGIAYNGSKYVSVGRGRTSYGYANVISTKTVKNELIPSRLEIIGEQYFNIENIDREIQFKSRLVDQNDNEILNYKVNWQVEKNDLGIKIDNDTGKLLIPKNCSKGEVLITARLNNNDKILIGKKIYIGKEPSIILKSKEVKLKKGQTLDLGRLMNTYENIYSVPISSSNSRIATVDKKYKLTAQNAGEATITFSNSRDGMDVDLKVIVLEEEYIKEDTNEDGVVDILDLSAVALKYNNKKYNFPIDERENFNKYDLNEDMIIDLYDLVFIGKRM